MGREQVSPKTFTLFINEISKLEAIEFIGLAKILCVPILDEKGKWRGIHTKMKHKFAKRKRIFLIFQAQKRRVSGAENCRKMSFLPQILQ